MNDYIFKQVALIGFGLIGSSLARALRDHSLCERIICGDLSPETCETVMAMNLADAATTDLRQAVENSDCVILAVPVGASAAVAQAIGPHLMPGCILSDVGSVKQAVIDAITPHISPNVHFIPGHPIAGTEHSGPESGFAALFHGRWCILTPPEGADPAAIAKIKSLWERCGSNVEIMDARRHDRVLAITSHLPHLIAYTIVGTADDLERHMKEDVIKFSAGGFRDFTRIAASNPVMWRDVFLHNRDAVLEIVQRFTEDLTGLQRAIRWEDGDALQTMFTRTRAIRRQIIDAKQAQ